MGVICHYQTLSSPTLSTFLMLKSVLSNEGIIYRGGNKHQCESKPVTFSEKSISMLLPLAKQHYGSQIHFPEERKQVFIYILTFMQNMAPYYM